MVSLNSELQALSNSILTFWIASHNTFFNMMAELEDPRQFPKALALLQSINISLYVVISLVIYRYAGDGVASPALGSTSPIASKVAYGLALPTVSKENILQLETNPILTSRRSSLPVSFTATSLSKQFTFVYSQEQNACIRKISLPSVHGLVWA